jgi:SAM-dependent methyltransferase
MNPYQRIDKIGQKGHIDTVKKFEQLTEGIDLKGKRVLDIGCNLGVMCRMAADAGAKSVHGVDIRRDYIEQARELWPDLTFSCTPAEGITGTYDVIIMSAMFHYLRDPEKAMNQVARCLDPDGVVTMDVWLHETENDVPMQFWDEKRNKWIPNHAGFVKLGCGSFMALEQHDKVLSPDDSERFAYCLWYPSPTPAKAVIIHGPGGSGKTTLAKTYHGYAHLQMDSVFVSWSRTHAVDTMSVRLHADQMYSEHLKTNHYLDFTLDYVTRWLERKQHHDIVIEGYDLMYPQVRLSIRALLEGYGWLDVEEIEL